MRFSAFFPVALPALAAATPTSAIPRWNHGDSDTRVLNFQLAVSQLKSAFYDEGLSKIDQNACHQAGFPDYALGRFMEIKEHVCAHTDFFQEAIRQSGADTVRPSFLNSVSSPLEDPKTFARASLDISTIAAAAYTGSIRLLENKDYSMANGMILSVEARQAGWVNSAVFEQNPWNTAFDTSLTARQAWTALSCFVESCPSENEELVHPQSLNPFPRLEIIDCLVPGQHGQAKFPGVEDCERRGLFIVFKTGFQEVRAQSQKDGTFIVPPEVENTGANFIFVTSNDKPVCDENIVAGPAIYQFDFGPSEHDYKWN